jgi:hypothetical protein
VRSSLPLANVLAVSAALLCAALGDLRAAIAPLAVAWGLLVLALPGTTAHTWAWALAVRVPLLLCAPTLSDDVWRYMWEGRVWLAGFNPFAHAPDAAVLAHLRNADWVHVAHKTVPTVYPPGAQGLFVLVAAGLDRAAGGAAALGGVLAWRVLSAGCDVVTAHLLSRRDGRAGMLWALLPLPALETAVSGHLEGPGVLCAVLALGGSGAFAFLGALVKLLPGVLLLRERPLRAAGYLIAGALCWLPMLHLDGLRTYGTTWAYNGSLFPVLEPLTGAATRPLLQLVGLSVVGTVAWRSRASGGGRTLFLWTSGTLVALSPVVHPWYALWPLAAALWPEGAEGVRGPSGGAARAWVLLAALMPLSYVVLATYDPSTSRWEESIWARWAIYAPFYALLAYDARRSRRSFGGPIEPRIRTDDAAHAR